MQSALVIGSGVIGCALAYEFARRGLAVTVVSASEAGEETSAASYAWANANEKTPSRYARLNQLGLSRHRDWSAALSPNGWFHPTGHLELIDAAANPQGVAARLAAHQQAGYAAERLGVDELAALEPALNLDGLDGAMWFAQEGWVDTHRFCEDLLMRAREHGAVFHPFMHVTAIDEHGIEARDRLGGRQRFTADICLLAAGHGIRPLLASQGIDFPVKTPKEGSAPDATLGLTCATTATSVSLQHMITTDDISIRPGRHDGLVLTDLATGGDRQRSRADLWTLPEALLGRACSLYPGLADAAVQSVQIGTRVLPEDGLSIVDRLPMAGRIYTVATHSGVTLAPYLAEALADEVLDGRRPAALNGFGLSRFG